MTSNVSGATLEGTHTQDQPNLDGGVGQFVALASPEAGIPVVLLAVVGGLVLLVIIAVLVTRGKRQRA